MWTINYNQRQSTQLDIGADNCLHDFPKQILTQTEPHTNYKFNNPYFPQNGNLPFQQICFQGQILAIATINWVSGFKIDLQKKTTMVTKTIVHTEMGIKETQTVKRNINEQKNFQQIQ